MEYQMFLVLAYVQKSSVEFQEAFSSHFSQSSLLQRNLLRIRCKILEIWLVRDCQDSLFKNCHGWHVDNLHGWYPGHGLDMVQGNILYVCMYCFYYT